MLETTCFNVQVRCASARRTLHFRKGALGIVTCEKSLSLCLFLPLTCPQLMVEHWFHTSATRWKASLPWHATSVRAGRPETSCVPQAQLQPVLLRFVCFLLSHPALFTARLWRWDSSAPVSCTDHIEIKGAKKDGMRRDTHLKSSWSSRVRLHHQIFSRL